MPTDADWGRLYKFNTTGDAGLVMPFRSYYKRDFFAGSWVDMAIGMIYAVCGSGGDLSAPEDERQAENAVVNLPHFGLTKANLTIDEVSANPRFLGLRGIMSGVTQITLSPLQLAQLYLTYVRDGTTQVQATPQILPLTNGTGTGPFAMVGLRFIHNPVTGILSINMDTDSSVTLADDAANTTTLSAFLQGLSSDTVTPDAQFSITSVADFSSYYLYWPYLHNKMKLHTVGALKNG